MQFFHASSYFAGFIFALTDCIYFVNLMVEWQLKKKKKINRLNLRKFLYVHTINCQNVQILSAVYLRSQENLGGGEDIEQTN